MLAYAVTDEFKAPDVRRWHNVIRNIYHRHYIVVPISVLGFGRSTTRPDHWPPTGKRSPNMLSYMQCSKHFSTHDAPRVLR